MVPAMFFAGFALCVVGAIDAVRDSLDMGEWWWRRMWRWIFRVRKGL